MSKEPLLENGINKNLESNTTMKYDIIISFVLSAFFTSQIIFGAISEGDQCDHFMKPTRWLIVDGIIGNVIALVIILYHLIFGQSSMQNKARITFTYLLLILFLIGWNIYGAVILYDICSTDKITMFKTVTGVYILAVFVTIFCIPMCMRSR